jgi:hypothetical protein
VTFPTGSPPSGAYVTGTVSDAQGQSEEGIRNQIRSGATNGFGQAQNLLWGPGGPLEAILMALTGFAKLFEAQQFSEEQIATVNDHSRQITELREAYGQIILQGNSIVFTSNNTYYPTTGVLSVDVIVIGAGAGGASGFWSNTRLEAGGGGGGGGSTHTSIPASLLPRNPDGSFAGIAITIGAGGTGAPQNNTVGVGGGSSRFATYLTGGGGVGGLYGASALPANGGTGMIPGGKGGQGGYLTQSGVIFTSTAGTDSVSQFDLHGGGGGGGAGAIAGAGNTAGQTTTGRPGGQGGISAGGLGGTNAQNGQPGTAPDPIIATGGGGGGGGGSTMNQGQNGYAGGAGAFPGGGGGGGGITAGGQAGDGGSGGNGILYVIERFS